MGTTRRRLRSCTRFAHMLRLSSTSTRACRLSTSTSRNAGHAVAWWELNHRFFDILNAISILQWVESRQVCSVATALFVSPAHAVSPSPSTGSVMGATAYLVHNAGE